PVMCSSSRKKSAKLQRGSTAAVILSPFRTKLNSNRSLMAIPHLYLQRPSQHAHRQGLYQGTPVISTRLLVGTTPDAVTCYFCCQPDITGFRTLLHDRICRGSQQLRTITGTEHHNTRRF